MIMNIAIEAQRIFRREKHGMDIVALETIRELQKRRDGHQYYVFVAPDSDRCLEDSDNLTIIEVKCPTYPLWEQVALPWAVRQIPKIDLLHCTSNTAPLHCSVPLVLTLHDIIYLDSKKPKGFSLYQEMGWYYRQWNVPRIINRCHAIMTVSAKEQERIIRYFPQITDKLRVVHNGYSSSYRTLSLQDVQSVTSHYLPDKDYLLHMGNTDPRKNTKGVLQAYAYYLKQSMHPRKLIITSLSHETVMEYLHSMNLESCAPQILCPGYIPKEDLPALYNGAFAFLFPSFQEGFGIPIIESMACGTPVVSSNCSAMPEVAGHGAILIDPFQPISIAQMIIRLETDSTFYQEQQSYGLQRAKLFSWSQTADKWLETYHSVLKH